MGKRYIREAQQKPVPEKDKVNGRFLPGNNGGPGRKKGSRVKLGEAFLTDLYNDWLAHGLEVIDKIRKKDPQAYVRIVENVVIPVINNTNMLIDNSTTVIDASSNAADMQRELDRLGATVMFHGDPGYKPSQSRVSGPLLIEGKRSD